MLSSFAFSGHQCFPNEAEASIHQEEIKLLPQERIKKKPGNAQLLTVTIVIISREIACHQVFRERWNFKNSSSSYLLVRTKPEGCDASPGMARPLGLLLWLERTYSSERGKSLSFPALVAHRN